MMPAATRPTIVKRTIGPQLRPLLTLTGVNGGRPPPPLPAAGRPAGRAPAFAAEPDLPPAAAEPDLPPAAAEPDLPPAGAAPDFSAAAFDALDEDVREEDEDVREEDEDVLPEGEGVPEEPEGEDVREEDEDVLAEEPEEAEEEPEEEDAAPAEEEEAESPGLPPATAFFAVGRRSPPVCGLLILMGPRRTRHGQGMGPGVARPAL
jgi:hypothetical protein